MSGYNYDWKFFDNLTNDLKIKAEEKFGKIRYNNWCPFKSPKGTMMAFHNSSYRDIRVINLDTMEIVINGEFYSHFDKEDEKNTVYSSHANHSTYVPSYWKFQSEKYEHVLNVDEIDEDNKHEFTLDNMLSAPYAINDWTIWAADYEFYVDILDLSEIDSGKIRKFDISPNPMMRNLSIPIEADHVRDYVKVDLEHWFHMNDPANDIPNTQSANITMDIQILHEDHIGRVSDIISNPNKFHDICHDKKDYSLMNETPWEENKKYFIEKGYYKGR